MQDLNDKVDNGGATAAGILAHTDWNEIASEVQSVIESTGQTLTGADLLQLGKAVAAMAQGHAFYGTDSGVADAYIVSTPVNTVFLGIGLFNGQHIRFRPSANNATTTPTLNAFGTGAITIISESGVAIPAGSLATTRDAELRYDGTNWRLLDRSTALRPVGTYPPGHIRNMLLGIDSGDTSHDFSVSAGTCLSSDGTTNLDLITPQVKQIDAVWAPGNNAGGRPTAVSLTANTYYPVFAIGGSSVTTQVGIDTSLVALNLLNDAGVGYDKYRHIGYILTDSSSDLVQFYQDPNDPDHFIWEDPTRTTSITLTVTSAITLNAQAPPNCTAEIYAHCDNFGSGAGAVYRHYCLISPLSVADIAPSAVTSNWTITSFNNSDESQSNVRMSVLVDASSSYRLRNSTINGDDPSISIYTTGFRFARNEN